MKYIVLEQTQSNSKLNWHKSDVWLLGLCEEIFFSTTRRPQKSVTWQVLTTEPTQRTHRTRMRYNIIRRP